MCHPLAVMWCTLFRSISPASMDKWVPYGQNQGIMPKLDPCGSHMDPNGAHIGHNYFHMCKNLFW